MSSKKSKTQQAKASKDQAAVVKASGLDLAKAGAALNAAKISITKTLAEIDSQLVEKIGDLEAINATIELKKKELTELHGSDNVLRSLDDLRVELETKREDVRKDIEKLEADAEQVRADLEEQRVREEEQFRYALSQKRKAEQDIWNETTRVQQAKERDRKEELEKGWTVREGDLRKQEQEYFEAKKKLETFDSEAKKLADSEVAKVAAVLKKDFEHQSKLVAVTHQAEVSGLHKDVEAAVAATRRLEAELVDTKAQLKAANEAQVALAKATVEGASTEKTLASATSLLTNIGGGNGTRQGVKS